MTRYQKIVAVAALSMVVVALGLLAWNQARLDAKYDKRYEWTIREVQLNIDYIDRLHRHITGQAVPPGHGEPGRN